MLYYYYYYYCARRTVLLKLSDIQEAPCSLSATAELLVVICSDFLVVTPLVTPLLFKFIVLSNFTKNYDNFMLNA